MSSIYPEKSEELRKQAEEMRAQYREKAIQEMSKNLVKAAETLTHAMTDDDCDPNLIALKKLQKDSAVQLLKFSGFAETTKNEHSGQIKFEPVKFLHDDEKPAEVKPLPLTDL